MPANTPIQQTLPPNAKLPLNQSVPQDPLAELRNLHLPHAIDSWPWAPGWYFLIAFIVISLSLSIYFFIKHKRASLYKRQALQELKHIQEQHQQTLNTQQTTQMLSALLKKIALVHFPREKISRLSGESWLIFLDQISKSQDFTQGAGTLLGERLFKNKEDISADALEQEVTKLFEHCEALIKQVNSKKLREIQL